MDIKDILKDMTLIPALSGYEGKMAEYMSKAIKPFVDDISIDKAGNLITRIDGSDEKAPKIMIFAHMDQLGFIVRKIEKDGFLRLERLGGVPEKVMPATRVLIKSETGEQIPGVIGIKSHHATPVDEKYQVVPCAQLYVDIGATSKEEVRGLGIEVGCPVVYRPYFETLRGGRISATSVDNRGGCAILTKVAEILSQNRPKATTYIVGTVQEEFNLRGAMVAATKIMPDFAICLDIMVAGDTPDLKDRTDVKLGAGPVLGMYSFHGRGTLNGTIPHPKLVELVKTAAKKENIPLQRNAFVGLLTDASYVQLVGDGIPSIDLGYPCRYTHTPIEMVQIDDLEKLAKLVATVISDLGPDLELKRI